MEGERAREDSAYKDAIASLTAEFNRYKKERDDLTAQFQNSSTDFEGLQKNIKNMKNTIENYDNDITRFEQEIKTQKESFTKWLKTEKQGEAVVAVIYTRGFKDIAHELEKQADQISSPLMAEQMGTYVKSYTTVINSILVEDFIQTITEGTAKWNNEEPLRIELEKGSKGTIYLRIKRYELYPFQKPETGILKGASGSSSMKTALIQSAQDIEGFLSKNGYSYKNYDLSRAENSIREAGLANRHAEEGINAQARAYEEKISRLKTKITNAKDEKELQTNLLKKKGQQYEQMKTDIESLRKKRDESEKMFKESQTRLSEKKRIRESIIIKTALAAPKGSETAANASAEAIQDKLEEVKNDARTQHSSSTVTVINYQLKEDTAMQAVTEAKITGLKLISFINEGDSVKVKMAFRVKTVLDESPATVPAQVAGTSKKPAESKTVTPPPESPAAVSTQVTETSKKPAESKTVTPPPLEKGDS
ncbi:MAG: hypothetical protein HY279_05035, partial [Nitrospinae bacterium]|nr:hypothetical protein [Nitrospinota bacterium]